MPNFTVKESVLIGHGTYHEHKLYARPLKNLDAAVRLCTKKEQDDNQPFVEDDKGMVVHTGKMGKQYAEDYKSRSKRA